MNANYNYVLAEHYLWKAVDVKYPKTTRNGLTGKIVCQVKDRRLLDRAMGELAAGLAKPYARRYHKEMIRERLALLSTPRAVEDYYIRRGVIFSDSSADYSKYLYIARISVFYGQLLIREGHEREGMQYLRAWQRLIVQFIDDANSAFELGRANYVIKTCGNDVAEIYGQMGRKDLAHQTRTLISDMETRLQGSGTYRHSGFGHDYTDDFIVEHGGRMANYLSFMPRDASHPINIQTLAPVRQFAQTVFEQFWLGIALLSLLVLLVINLVASAVRFRRLPRAYATSLFVLPSWKTLVRIYCLSIIPPVALYYLYSRCSAFANRELNVQIIALQFSIECMLVIFSILVLLDKQTKAAIRQRCSILGIPVPGGDAASSRKLVSPWLVKLLLFSLTLLALYSALYSEKSIYDESAVFILVIAFVVVITGIAVFSIPKRGFSLYYGIVARTRTFVFAVAILLFACTLAPYLSWYEVDCIKRDRLVFPSANELTYTAYEAQVIPGVRQKIVGLLNEEAE